MDNYFTLPKVCKKLRDLGIGVLGTARGRDGWPPAELHETTIKSKVGHAMFNSLFWTVDAFGTLVARWMDNSLVYIVTTVHNITDTVKKERKRPRVTKKNKRHVDSVWGTLGKIYNLCYSYYSYFIT